MKLYWLEMDFSTGTRTYSYKAVVMAENALKAVTKFVDRTKLGGKYECTSMEIHPISGDVRIV